ncbi:potassium channel family protein [Pseudoxanthomonas indica]|uniref:Ion channel n=1 Tax=Pseudoxanthomonas indica TaxID=428993 RepID=A0A1T5M1H0_9GAMM|nr:potassium channel family protein [Pseudoxanthomonas indica]GGD60377.1 hypothetical protein GCM10007235_35710 [Pseudoxanthomonas indica]SKC82080.1 Ion channel [Pseudoxanthomonas indica]
MRASPAHLLQGHRYALLFWSLLATISVGPLLDALHFGDDAMEALLFGCLIAAVFPIGVKIRRAVLVLLVLAVQLLRWLARDVDTNVIPIAGAVLWCGLGGMAAYHSIRYSLSAVAVDVEHFYAALSGYLLLGMCGGVIVATLSTVWPGSMMVGGQPATTGLDFGDSLYFSFVTLATLGYGDITPASKVMRGLALFECIVGQLYLALLIARLVGLRGAVRSG